MRGHGLTPCDNRTRRDSDVDAGGVLAPSGCPLAWEGQRTDRSPSGVEVPRNPALRRARDLVHPEVRWVDLPCPSEAVRRGR